MIDFSKAFDRVDNNILLEKLSNFNVPPPPILLNWCANFLEHRYFRVKMGKIKPDWNEINAGVPQGTILDPLFFLIMINDLTTTLPLYKYVDDCTAYEVVSRPTNYTMVQTDLNIVNTWTEANNMRRAKAKRVICLSNFQTKWCPGCRLTNYLLYFYPTGIGTCMPGLAYFTLLNFI
jgi:hypothetical protein